jgi:hypothetical protein
MQRDDEILRKVSKILRKHSINFWVCHGTLLGIIRENRILPWDRDIDLAVWDHETDRNYIAKIFEESGFKQEYFFADVDSLHFHGEGKNIDINFFKKTKSTGSWQGAVVADGFLNKVVIHIGYLVGIKDIKKIELPKKLLKRAFYIFFAYSIILINNLLPIRLVNYLNSSALKRISYIGYSYPVELLNFKEIIYKGINLQVPIDSEKCLELTYGANWREPKKDYVWHKDASNLINSEDNI